MKYTLAELCHKWNWATCPYTLRTDHEHRRCGQLAKATMNRIKRGGYYWDRDFKEWSNGTIYPIERFRQEAA